MAESHPAMQELRNLPAADLEAQLAKLRRDLWLQRIKAKEGALQQTHLLRVLRRQIARIETARQTHRTRAEAAHA